MNGSIVNVWDWHNNIKVASNKISTKVKAISFAENGNYFQKRPLWNGIVCFLIFIFGIIQNTYHQFIHNITVNSAPEPTRLIKLGTDGISLSNGQTGDSNVIGDSTYIGKLLTGSSLTNATYLFTDG